MILDSGSVGVRGSSPLCSTNEKSLCLAKNIGFVFGYYALRKKKIVDFRYGEQESVNHNRK